MRAVKGIAAALILAALPWASAQAGVHWSIGLNFPIAPYYYEHPHPYYYYRPYPVYVQPAPILVEAAPVYRVAPVVQPVYSSPVESAPPAPTPLPPPTPTPAQAAAWAPDAAEPQLQLLNHNDDRTRADAAVQLGRMKATRAVAPLTQLLNADRSASVREAAARGLGLIGSPDALPALQRAAQADDDRDVRHSAQFAAEVIRANMPR